MILHGTGMFGVVANRQQSAMDFGMQGLDPTVHHFREASQVRHVADLEAGLGECSRGAPGGDELDAEALQPPGERDQSDLVGYRNEGSGDRAHMFSHGWS